MPSSLKVFPLVTNLMGETSETDDSNDYDPNYVRQLNLQARSSSETQHQYWRSINKLLLSQQCDGKILPTSSVNISWEDYCG